MAQEIPDEPFAENSPMWWLSQFMDAHSKTQASLAFSLLELGQLGVISKFDEETSKGIIADLRESLVMLVESAEQVARVGENMIANIERHQEKNRGQKMERD